MEALQGGRDSGLSELMTRHQVALFRFVYRLLQSDSDAEDVTQETFVKIYHHRKTFDLNRRFSTWMYQIASNLVKDHFRWRSRHPETSLSLIEDGFTAHEQLIEYKSTPATEAIKVESARAVEKAIGELPPEFRVPLVLSQYEEKSHREIAEITGASVKAVETRIYRAKQQLRERLAHYLGLNRAPV